MDNSAVNYSDEINNQGKISKATKMVILGDKFLLEKVKYLCDYHYEELVESGATLFSHSALLSEFNENTECDYCKRER